MCLLVASVIFYSRGNTKLHSLVLCATLARLIVLGDSLGVGLGASTPAHAYASILAAELDLSLDMRAVSGTTVAQQAIPTDLCAGDTVVWIAGYNDMRAGHDAQEVGQAVHRAVQAMRSQGAAVYIASPIPMTEAGYAAYAPAWNHGSDASLANYRAALPGSVRIAYNPVNVTSDVVHPNDTGYRQIANSFLAAMRRRVYLPL